MRLVNHFPQTGYYELFLPFSFFFMSEIRADIQQRAGGAVGQNMNHDYRHRLTEADRDYLAGLGVDVNTLLKRMHEQRFAGPLEARRYMRKFSAFSGKITETKVLAIDEIGDGLSSPSMQHAYRQFVVEAEQQRNLYQTFTTGMGFHCSYTTSQLSTAVNAMNTWLKDGIRPSPSSFPESIGFDNAFRPGPWLNPIRRGGEDRGDGEDESDEDDD